MRRDSRRKQEEKRVGRGVKSKRLPLLTAKREIRDLEEQDHSGLEQILQVTQI